MSAADPSLPLAPEEAAQLFEPLSSAAGIVVAVSGGPDSMALMLLLARWRAANPAGPPLWAATVDHGLRPELAAEADAVARCAGELGLPHGILRWEGDKPSAGIQEAARNARYALLAAHARERGCTHVAAAHHADDQAETVLMRLLRGSGIAGLAGMAPLSIYNGLVLARPFLGTPKARLVATARAAGLPVVNDPSNADPRFERARLRRAAPALARAGLSRAVLLRLAERAARADAALEGLANAGWAAYAAVAAHGAVTLAPLLLDEPLETVLRVLLRAVAQAAGDRAPVRLERAERLACDLVAARRAGRAIRRTLGGAAVSLDGLGQVTIAGEKTKKARTSGSDSRPAKVTRGTVPALWTAGSAVLQAAHCGAFTWQGVPGDLH